MIRLQQSKRGLGSNLLITIISKNEELAQSIFQDLWTYVDGFENRFSRFKKSSELSKFNLNAGRYINVSSEFIALLKKSIQMSKKSNKLFNPLVLPSLQSAGYKGSWPNTKTHDKKLDFSRRKLFDAKLIEIKDKTAKIPENSALDFGGIGKGYLLEKLSEKLSKHEIKNYWISLGGDIICQGFDLDNKPWKIGISSADDENDIAKTITNKEGNKLAIASSGIVKRKGTGWHHIIDPRTGKPAETDVLVATYATPDAIEADVFAKCLVVMGSQEAEEFIKHKNYYAAVLQIVHNKDVELKSL